MPDPRPRLSERCSWLELTLCKSQSSTFFQGKEHLRALDAGPLSLAPFWPLKSLMQHRVGAQCMPAPFFPSSPTIQEEKMKRHPLASITSIFFGFFLGSG